MNKKIIGIYNLANSVTYLGVILSVLAIILLNKNTNYSIICLALAGICDLFDGRIARMFKRTDEEKKYGIEIDSLADVVNFVVCPACVLVYLCGNDIICDIIAVIYVLAGITRLAWFNITTDGNTGFYQGLPVTYSALFISVIYVIIDRVSVLASYSGYIFKGLYILLAILFVLNIKIKKPTGVWYVIFSLIAIATIVLLIV